MYILQRRSKQYSIDLMYFSASRYCIRDFDGMKMIMCLLEMKKYPHNKVYIVLFHLPGAVRLPTVHVQASNNVALP